jgi:hypothetical protein
MPQVKDQIDTNAATTFLRAITADWFYIQQDVRLELRCLFRGKTPQIAHFHPTEAGIAEAADFAASMNRYDYNIYPVINPVKAEKAVSGRAASDDDIAAAVFHWADSDDQASADALRNFAGPRPNMVVITGTTPLVRPHAYWHIADGPITDLAAWRTVQEGIAATFGSDPTVVNASRIMRLPGMVNWPTDKKAAAGRVAEIATVTVFEDRERVPFDRMQRTFGGATPARTVSGQALEIDTGGMAAPLDRKRTRIQALSGQDWHNAVIKLVASYVSRGLSDDEIHGLTDPLTLPGYTVEQTRREVQTAINGARLKGWTPEPGSKTFEADQNDSKQDTMWPTPLSDFDEMALPRRRWIYGYDYIRGFVSVVASAGGVGKTSQAIVEALAIVTGRPLLGVAVKEATNVWVVNLEDPLDELRMRTLAAMKHYGIKPDEVRGKLFLDGEDTIQITLAAENRDGVQINEDLVERMRAKITENGIGATIFDPFISTHLVNENSNAAIQAVVALFRSLARSTESSVSLVHHIRKGNGDEATVDSVRGAGSLIGAARAARVINRVSERAAIELGINQIEAKGIFRVDDGKANLAPPAENAVYRRMVGVQLDNGEWVGVATPFELPDEWSGMDENTVNKILAAIATGPDNDAGTEEYYSPNKQAKERWVGAVITTWPFARAEDHKTDAQAKKIIAKWFEMGLLEEIKYHSASQRKDRAGVAVTGYVGDVK